MFIINRLELFVSERLLFFFYNLIDHPSISIKSQVYTDNTSLIPIQVLNSVLNANIISFVVFLFGVLECYRERERDKEKK